MSDFIRSIRASNTRQHLRRTEHDPFFEGSLAPNINGTSLGGCILGELRISSRRSDNELYTTKLNQQRAFVNAVSALEDATNLSREERDRMEIDAVELGRRVLEDIPRRIVNRAMLMYSRSPLHGGRRQRETIFQRVAGRLRNAIRRADTTAGHTQERTERANHNTHGLRITTTTVHQNHVRDLEGRGNQDNDRSVV